MVFFVEKGEVRWWIWKKELHRDISNIERVMNEW